MELSLSEEKILLLRKLCTEIEGGNEAEYKAILNDNPELLDCGKPGKGGGDWTPLHCACHVKNVASVRFLLSLGANISARNKKGMLPILMAARSTDQSKERDALEIIKLLVDKDKDMVGLGCVQQDGSWESQDAGKTALHYAVSSGFCSVAKFLLETGADVNTVTLDRNTPMAYCCATESNPNHEEMFDLLLEYRATLLEPVNMKSWSPIGKKPSVARLVEEWEATLKITRYTGVDPVEIYVQLFGDKHDGWNFWQSIKEQRPSDLTTKEWAFAELVRRRQKCL
eukprot:TRINITY_DN6300_c0_g2_i3.p1 TRINITY_DN6300_c0_g2~~TRINITY_DN6300_c0_g2_i3.p1  ORF type:complete len:284 (+),score=58.67 TRINITY_DN6300_c0_g2_i3:70-921(+)